MTDTRMLTIFVIGAVIGLCIALLLRDKRP